MNTQIAAELQRATDAFELAAALALVWSSMRELPQSLWLRLLPLYH
jgi:hypothetical protein